MDHESARTEPRDPEVPPLEEACYLAGGIMLPPHVSPADMLTVWKELAEGRLKRLWEAMAETEIEMDLPPDTLGKLVLGVESMDALRYRSIFDWPQQTLAALRIIAPDLLRSSEV